MMDGMGDPNKKTTGLFVLIRNVKPSGLKKNRYIKKHEPPDTGCSQDAECSQHDADWKIQTWANTGMTPRRSRLRDIPGNPGYTKRL